ncbi:MAG: hypothetical protein AB1778_07410, partial [Candidatus Bipolaricaulota bacterium]
PCAVGDAAPTGSASPCREVMSDDLRRMHSAEHILTAVMRRLYGSPRNVEVHLGDKKTKCDFAVPHALGSDDARTIEDAVNAEIARDLRVTISHISRRDAANLDLSKVPGEAETIRVVRIGDLDALPCSGEHVASTREIGRFALKSHEMRSPVLVRIRFGLESTNPPPAMQ